MSILLLLLLLLLPLLSCCVVDTAASNEKVQASAAAWSADDDAHEDKSEIDEQLNCVRCAVAAAAADALIVSHCVLSNVQVCMLARCNVPAAATFIIARLSPLVASHAPAAIATLHPSQRPLLHEQLYWLLRIVTCMMTDEEAGVPAQIADASRAAHDARADPCVAVLNACLPLVEYTMQLHRGGAQGLDVCSGSVTDVVAQFLSQFYCTYGCSSDSSVPPNMIAAFGGGGATTFTVAALQWCVSSIIAWAADESVCGACCACLQAVTAAQSKTRPLDASVLQVPAPSPPLLCRAHPAP